MNMNRHAGPHACMQMRNEKKNDHEKEEKAHTSASKMKASTTMAPAHVHQTLEIAIKSIQYSSSAMAPACNTVCELAGSAVRSDNADACTKCRTTTPQPIVPHKTDTTHRPSYFSGAVAVTATAKAV